jgi:hypothetical protein
MVRVVGHDGRIVVFDFDWETLIIDHPDKHTTRTIVLSYADSIRNGWIGRQLPRLFKEHHLGVRSFDPVQVFVHYSLAELFLGSHLTRLQTNGILSPDSARGWWDYLRQADGRGTLMITDGPYVETKEFLGGFAVVDVADDEAAKMWAGKIAEACGWPHEVRRFKPQPRAE